MNDFKSSVKDARAGAQRLYAKLEAANAKQDASLRADALDVSREANQLASALKAIARGEEADAKQHLQAASALFEQISQETRKIADAGEAELRSDNAAALAKARAAVQKLGEAITDERASRKPVNA